MNDAWGYTDENEPQDQNLNNGPKPLRDAYKAMKDQNKELMDRLAALEQRAKQSTVADLIESQGVARSAAKYYQGDADPEHVTSWVNDLRGAFGGANPSTPEQAQQPVINQDQMNQYQRMTEAGQGGTPTGNMDAIAANLASAENLDQLLAAFTTHVK